MICTKYQVQSTMIFKMQNSILIRIPTLYLVPGTLYFSISIFGVQRPEFDIKKVSSSKYQDALEETFLFNVNPYFVLCTSYFVQIKSPYHQN
jgi:hypothetical protein